QAIQAAGGTLTYSYNAIGVVIASSSSDSFAANIQKDKKVEGTAATGGLGTAVDDAQLDQTDTAVPNTPAPGSDNLSGLQWDMIQIHAPEAHAITGGDPSVVVGDIDTGIDYTHPDLAPNVDFSNSVSCVGGVPNTAPSAWND